MLALRTEPAGSDNHLDVESLFLLTPIVHISSPAFSQVRWHAVISGLKFVLLHKESGRFGVIDKIPLVLQQRST